MASTAWIDATIKPPQDVLDAHRDLAQQLPALVTRRFRQQAVAVRRIVLTRLRIVPGSPHHPIRWKSRRQQRAYFASNGFGGGIPTTRTGLYQDSFDVIMETADFGGFIRVINTDPAAPFIGGDEQQPFHIDTGYLSIASVISDERPAVEALLIDDYFLLADPRAVFQ